ncbi:MAG: hypothetical protein ACFCVF_10395 [Kineosporiaceae bacterium]
MTSSRQAMSIRPQRARTIVEDCIELLGQIMYERTALMALVVPPTAWGQLGSPAAAGTQQWMQQVNQTLLTLIQFHELLQKLIKEASNRYENEDQDTEQQFRALQSGLPA